MKQKRIRKLMTISIDEDTMREFKENCVKHGLKMSRVLEQSMKTFNQLVKQKEMEEENND